MAYPNVRSTRSILYLTFFLAYIVFDAVLLGLVAQQLHKYGNTAGNYPAAEYYHALGLLLFSSIVGLLLGLLHWGLGLVLLIPVMLVS